MVNSQGNKVLNGTTAFHFVVCKCCNIHTQWRNVNPYCTMVFVMSLFTLASKFPMREMWQQLHQWCPF